MQTEIPEEEMRREFNAEMDQKQRLALARFEKALAEYAKIAPPGDSFQDNFNAVMLTHVTKLEVAVAENLTAQADAHRHYGEEFRAVKESVLALVALVKHQSDMVKNIYGRNKSP